MSESPAALRLECFFPSDHHAENEWRPHERDSAALGYTVNRSLQLRLDRLPHLPVFATLGVAVVALGVTALERSANATVVVTAVTIDLVVVIPALHYLLVVRGRGLPAITVLPVFRLSLAVASIVLPPGVRPLYDLLEHLSRPAELGMAGYVLYRLHLGWRAFRSAGMNDALDRYRVAVRAALPPTVPSVDRAADAIAFEAALLSFATRAFRSRPEFPAEATSFTGHRASAYGSFVGALLMVLIVEVIVVHLLVSLWSATVAWLLTGLSIYAIIWILGDLQAIRLRPTWVDDHQACLRLGLRWTVTVPHRQIGRVRKLRIGERIDGALRLALPNARRVLIELNMPAAALGAYGIRRSITAIELGVDDPDAFLQQLGHNEV